MLPQSKSESNAISTSKHLLYVISSFPIHRDDKCDLMGEVMRMCPVIDINPQFGRTKHNLLGLLRTFFCDNNETKREPIQSKARKSW